MIAFDGIQIDESDIIGLDTFNIKTKLSEFFHGYLTADGYGVSDVSSDGTICVENPELVKYIKAKFEAGGIGATIEVKITQGGETGTLYVDFSQYSEDGCCKVCFSFRPSGSGSKILSRYKVKYPVTLNTEIEVPIKTLPDVVTFDVDEETYSNTSGVIGHSVPLKLVTQPLFGTTNNVGVNENEPFFIANQDRCITLNGAINFTTISDVATTFDVVLVVNSTEEVIDTLPATQTLQNHTVAISTLKNLKNGDSVYLKIRAAGGETLDTVQFSYQENSNGINISECINAEKDWRKVKAVSYRDAFSQVINTMTNGDSALVDYIFDNCLHEQYLTNNDGLWNETSTINVSLFELFEELNNKYPIALDFDENGDVVIVSRCEYLSCPSPYFVNVYQVKREINSDNIYSDIKVGYNNWQADSEFSSLEINGNRNFSSDYDISGKSLSLLNDWSASGTIISEQILKRKNKQEIHVIVVEKSTLRAETNEYIDSNGIYLADRTINQRITPGRNLNRWRKFINNNMVFESGEGNSAYDTTDSETCTCGDSEFVDETSEITNESIYDLFKYDLQIERCAVSVAQLRKCIAFMYCGELKKAFVTSVEYTLGQTGNEIIQVEAAGLR